MRLFAFQGIRYRDSATAGSLAAPPYDQIDEQQRDAFHALSPHHFAHLSKPLPDGEEGAYRHADHLHRSWLADGTLQVDSQPSLYPSVIELADGGRRLGLTALVGLEPTANRVIRPHEETLAKPLADRLALLSAMRVDLEPILLVVEDDGALERLLAEDLGTAHPLAVHRDAAGHRHLFYRLSDPARLAAYRQAMATAPAAIADGHHRYKVAQRFAEQQGVQDGAAAAKLAVITSVTSPGLTIDPIHRALEGRPDLGAARALARRTRPLQPTSGADFAAAVAAAEQPALGLLLGDGAEIWELAAGEGAAALGVAALHERVLPALGLTAAAASDGTLLYRSDPDSLFRQVRSGEAAVGWFLPPMTPASFSEAIAGGRMLPPKSTRFLPKVVSGLVWSAHDSALA